MKLLILGILFLMLFSCNRTEKSGDKLFEINPGNFSEEQFKLSDIVDDIKYIPLDNSFPLGLFYNVKIAGGNIYASFKDIGIVKFDLNGRFVKIIAHKGEGPGEFLYCMDFVVDERENKLYDLDQGRIMIYSLDGDFSGKFSTQTYFTGMADAIELLGSNLFLADYGYNGEYKNYWVVVDSVGNLMSCKESSDHPAKHVLGGRTIKYNEKILYHNGMNDTIFSISPDFKVGCAYLFARGDFRWPKDGIEISTLVSKSPNYFKPHIVVESTHFMLMDYSYKNKFAFLLIEKQTHKTFQAFKSEKTGTVDYVASIENDVDDGLPVEEIYGTYDDAVGTYLKCVINPVELKAHVASQAFKSSTPKYPEKKKALEKLANSLDENGNPVLMLVKLKE